MPSNEPWAAASALDQIDQAAVSGGGEGAGHLSSRSCLAADRGLLAARLSSFNAFLDANYHFTRA
jgi:hypothetical protein